MSSVGGKASTSLNRGILGVSVGLYFIEHAHSGVGERRSIVSRCNPRSRQRLDFSARHAAGNPRQQCAHCLARKFDALPNRLATAYPPGVPSPARLPSLADCHTTCCAATQEKQRHEGERYLTHPPRVGASVGGGALRCHSTPMRR